MITSVIVAKRIRSTLKNGRKIFKFLKSIDEIKAINQLLKKSQFTVLWILRLLVKVLGALYYALDNYTWLTSMGLLKVSV